MFKTPSLLYLKNKLRYEDNFWLGIYKYIYLSKSAHMGVARLTWTSRGYISSVWTAVYQLLGTSNLGAQIGKSGKNVFCESRRRYFI